MSSLQNSPFLLEASLYCEEHHWDEDEEDEEEESYCTTYNNTLDLNPKPPLLLIEQSLLWEDDELSSLLSREKEQSINNGDLETDPCLVGARLEAIERMMRVVAHHSFGALTAVLAVNYLDRFLPSFQFQREKPWMIQLVSVACLSLAAKVEETHAPLLLDLQVEETRYVFKAKTIQEMEILILSRLEWKMNPVTPLSFLDYITRRLLEFHKNHLLSLQFLNRCHSLILSVISECKFMRFLPSVLATATMLHVISNLEPCMGMDYHNQLMGILPIDKDKIEDCLKLIHESTLRPQKRKFRSTMPGSPNGVTDVSFSSDDTSNDSWVAASASASVSSSPEPPLWKKSRGSEPPLAAEFQEWD